MARYLLLLLFLLLRIDNVQAACYASTWSNGVPVYSSLFVDGGTTLSQCQAIACQAFPGISESCPSACHQVTDTQTLSCPTNFSGQITQTRIKTCPDNQWQAWQTTQNTCVANPPTCQISSQQQTLSCQTGYTGSIIQTRSSICPDPYGQPVWQPWVTSSNTCVKSVTNPTNVSSPVSPISPANPANTATASATTPAVSSAPASSITQPTQTDGSSVPTVASSAPASTAQTDAKVTTQTNTTQTPKGKVQTALGLALSMDLIIKPALTQPSMFVEPQLIQGLPNDVLFSNQLFMDLYGGSLGDQSGKLKRMAQDAVELEQ